MLFKAGFKLKNLARISRKVKNFYHIYIQLLSYQSVAKFSTHSKFKMVVGKIRTIAMLSAVGIGLPFNVLLLFLIIKHTQKEMQVYSKVAIISMR